MLADITIEKKHVIDFVLGKTALDPIERALGDPSRYEVLDEFIYDHELKCNLPQPKVVTQFCSQANRLRREFAKLKGSSPRGNREEIFIQLCNSLMEVAPTQVYLR